MSIIQNAGLVNPQNSHFSNPGFSSKVGGVSGCGGSPNSQCGGKRRTKRSTKNKRKVNKKKRTVKKRKNSKRRKTKVHKKRQHKQKGGYSQYMSNVANTHGYALGGQLNPVNSSLASPPPVTPYSDCRENYNHFNFKS